MDPRQLRKRRSRPSRNQRRPSIRCRAHGNAKCARTRTSSGLLSWRWPCGRVANLMISDQAGPVGPSHLGNPARDHTRSDLTACLPDGLPSPTERYDARFTGDLPQPRIRDIKSQVHDSSWALLPQTTTPRPSICPDQHDPPNVIEWAQTWLGKHTTPRREAHRSGKPITEVGCGILAVTTSSLRHGAVRVGHNQIISQTPNCPLSSRHGGRC